MGNESEYQNFDDDDWILFRTRFVEDKLGLADFAAVQQLGLSRVELQDEDPLSIQTVLASIPPGHAWAEYADYPIIDIDPHNSAVAWWATFLVRLEGGATPVLGPDFQGIFLATEPGGPETPADVMTSAGFPCLRCQLLKSTQGSVNPEDWETDFPFDVDNVDDWVDEDCRLCDGDGEWAVELDEYLAES